MEKFSAGQVTAAAGITNAALQTWIRRGVIAGGVEMPGKPGIRRRFSLASVMEIAVAAALIQDGADVCRAFAAARGASPAPRPGRTILVLAAENSAVIHWAHGDDLYAHALTLLRNPIAIRLLDINAVFDRVALALGLHPI